MVPQATGESISLVVETPDPRVDAIIMADLGRRSISPGARFWLQEELHDAAKPSEPILGQVDDAGHLVWVLAGETPAKIPRVFAVSVAASRSESDQDVRVDEHPAILVIRQNDRVVAHYNFRSVWKPYVCPLNSPAGNVVRGASAEHQHQAGLFFSYGGHFTPTNIWSDWDEPIYGPDGKMLHREFERLTNGPVFAEIVERVGYMAADGRNLLDERRIIRFYPLPDGTTVVDLTRTCPRPAESSDGPFSLSVRVADPLRTVDNSRRGPPPERKMLPTENPGKMENSSGEVSQGENLESTRWLDRSGALSGGWGGIAFLDHPANPAYPGRIGAAGYGTIMLSYRFPQGAQPVTWQYRVIAHAGDASVAQIEQRWQDYANPASVKVGG